MNEISISGVIVTEPKIENGKTMFALHEGRNHDVIPCMSASGFLCRNFCKGENVSLLGEHKRDIITKSETVDFIFNSIELIK